MTDLRMLEAFGLSDAAERIYRVMLQRPTTGVAELADELGLAEPDVRAALDELGGLSLLRPSWEDPRTLRPVRPEVGLEPILAREQAELLRRQHRIEDGRAALAVLLADLANRRSIEQQSAVEEMDGIDAVRERLEMLTHETHSEVLTFAPGGAQSLQAPHAGRQLDQQLLDRGVSVRTVYLDSVRNDPVTTRYARWLTEHGGHVRTVPVLPLRMIVVDRAVAVVPTRPERSGVGVALLRNLGAVAAMTALFEQVWEGAAPFGEQRPRDGRGLTPQESALLRLMNQGDTDEVVARRLGVSVRTVRRIASELMARLGARSRFQAGVRAAERQWLAPHTTPH